MVKDVQWWMDAGQSCLAKDGTSYSGIATREFSALGKRFSVEMTITRHSGTEKVLAGFVRVNGYKNAEIQTTVGAQDTMVTYGFLPMGILETVAVMAREIHAELAQRSAAAWGW